MKKVTRKALLSLAQENNIKYDGFKDGGYIEDLDHLFPEYIRVAVTDEIYHERRCEILDFTVLYLKANEIHEQVDLVVNLETVKKLHEERMNNYDDYCNKAMLEWYREAFENVFMHKWGIRFEDLYVDAYDKIFDYLEDKVPFCTSELEGIKQ